MPKQLRLSDRKSIKHPVVLYPRVGTIKTSSGDRAIGRSMSLEMAGPVHTVFHDLAADIFHSLYKYSPALVDEHKLPLERKVTRALMSWFLQQDYYHSARDETMLSTPAALAATKVLWERLMNDEIIRQVANKMVMIDNLCQQSKQQGQSGSGKQQSNKKGESKSAPQPGNQPDDQEGEQDEQDDHNQEPSDSNQEQSKDEVEQQQRAREQAEKLAEQLIKQFENNGLITQSIKEAIKDAKEEGQRVREVMRSWGLEDGQGQLIDLNSIYQLADANSEYIQKIAEAVGRVKQAAARALEQVRVGYIGPPTEATPTRDLSRIFPTERIKLSPQAPKIIRTLQVARYVEEGLLGWKPASEGKQAGSFVAYIDTSGSMRGDPVYTAKAIAYGLAKVLMEDPRRSASFLLRSFGAESQITEAVTEQSSISELLKWLRFMYAYGTEFNTPFLKSIKDVEDLAQRGIVGVDMLFITDGQAEVGDEVYLKWQKMRAQHGVRLFFINIMQGDYFYSGYHSQLLPKICDFSLNVSVQDFINNPEILVIDLVHNIYQRQVMT